MKICGIISEYNPFHTGHAHQIVQTRTRLGEDTAIVCVMSGNFVQRGEPAVFAKHARAEAAVRSAKKREEREKMFVPPKEKK